MATCTFTRNALESNKDPYAGLENIQGVILDTAYGVHTDIEAKSDECHQCYLQTTPIVETKFCSQAGKAVSSRMKQAHTGCRVRREYGGGQFQPQIRTVEKGIARRCQ